MKASQKLALARACVSFKANYFSVGVCSFIPQPIEGLVEQYNACMGVTKGLILYYDPKYIETQNEDMLAACIFHEALHVYLDHIRRIESIGVDLHIEADRQLANMAADFAANCLLRQAGWQLKDVLYPENYNLPENLTIEQYWDLLNKQRERFEEEANSLAESQTQNPIGNGLCGGIAGNSKLQEFENALDAEGGRTQIETTLIQQQMANAVREAAAQGRGDVPGNLLNQAPNPSKRKKVPWPKILRSIAIKLTGQIEGGGSDFSVAFPSKRSYVRGIIRPGMIQHKMEPVFVIDTSGSMQVNNLQSATSHVIGVMKSMGCDGCWLIQADTKVHDIKRYNMRKLQNMISYKGRGGTNFDAALKAAVALKAPKPDVIFYMTDGDGYVAYKPPIPTVFVVIPSYYNRKPAEWGKTVFVDD